jgi:hypothetical protein
MRIVTKTATALALGLLLLGAAAPAEARHDRDRDRYEHDRDRYDRNRSHYDRGHHADLRELRREAHRLEKTARHAYRAAVRHAHHPGRRERRALDALSCVAVAADRLHDAVAGRGNPHRAHRAFRELERAVAEARWRVRHLHADRRVRRDLHRVAERFRSVELAYASLRGPHGRHHARHADLRPLFELAFVLR